LNNQSVDIPEDILRPVPAVDGDATAAVAPKLNLTPEMLEKLTKMIKKE